MTKPKSDKEAAEFFYRKGRSTEREQFRVIISDMRSSLTKTLMHLRNVFSKYKKTQSNEANPVFKNIFAKEEVAVNKAITEIESSSDSSLELFKQGEDE